MLIINQEILVDYSDSLQDLLSPEEFGALYACFKEAADMPHETLLSACKAHADLALRLSADDSKIDIKSAVSLASSFSRCGSSWWDIAEEKRAWIKAAMFYFAHTGDDEPDFTSILGFDDDRRIANACFAVCGFEEFSV